MTATTFIYALLEPDSDDVRYIGKADNPKSRLSEHVNYRAESRTYKSHWIQSLQKQGKNPKLVILEEVPVEQWQEAERRWVAHYQEKGARLTNIHPGGWGGSAKGWKAEKTKGRPAKIAHETAGRPRFDPAAPTLRTTIRLTQAQVARAEALGNGNVAQGVRNALDA
jgi:predicted GIY-YIG superfamily endonuclease